MNITDADSKRIRRRRQRHRQSVLVVLLLLFTVTRPNSASGVPRQDKSTTTHIRRRLQTSEEGVRQSDEVQDASNNPQPQPEETFSGSPYQSQEPILSATSKPTKKKDHSQSTANATASASEEGSLEEPDEGDQVGEDSSAGEESPPYAEQNPTDKPDSANAATEEDSSSVGENQTDPPSAKHKQGPTKSPSSASSNTEDHTLPNSSPDAPTRSSEVSDDDRSKLDSKEELLRGEKSLDANVTAIGGVGVALALAAMIFTAWQMSDNPDGVYAAACRLVITVIGLIIRILLTPCRYCCCHGSRYAGHMPVHTMDYGFRDPALELS